MTHSEIILSQKPLIRLINGDCEEFMKPLQNKSFDLAIVDPPYGIGQDGSKNHLRGKLAKAKDYRAFAGGDKSSPSPEYFKKLLDISNNQIIWGANHFISKIPIDSSCWIVWNKDNGNTYNADCELAWTSFKTSVRLFRYRWSGMLQGDMKNKERRIHPTQKPVALYKWLLNRYAKQGDGILDTHGGSMSSVIAAYDMGYDITCIELDKYYYEIGVNRVKAFIAQNTLSF